MKFTQTHNVAISILAAAHSVVAGTLLWDGRMNDLTAATDLEKWSFSNPVGPFQYYIHGTSPVDSYVALSSDFGNPADSSSTQGAKITLDSTAYWNGQNMRRTELIPQVSDASTIVSASAGPLFYHFSLKRGAENVPAMTREHQIAFFESHFTELKAGGSGATALNLEWYAGGQAKWSSKPWEADVWHNFAYEIDFGAGTVGLWHSTGGEALTRVVDPVTASTSSNGADWHVGVLELQGQNGEADAVEDLFFSGVYIESGDVTTGFSGSSGGSPAPAPSIPAASTPAASTPAASTPAASTPAASIPAASTPAASTPAASTPAASTPAASTPASSPPAAPSTTLATSVRPATTSSAAPAITPSTTPAAPSATPSTGGQSGCSKRKLRRRRSLRA